MAIQRFTSESTAKAVVDAIARDGVAVVESAVSPSVMDAVRDELTPHLAATPLGSDEYAGFQTRRTGALIARSPSARCLVTHPLVLAVVNGVLAHATNFQLHLTQVIALEPGESAQAVHRDQWAFDFFPFPSGYEVQCNTIWAMTDFTEVNGATRVIPGSNRFQDRLTLTADDTEPVVMAKGSVVLYTGSLYHGGGSNHSRETRMAVNIGYSLAWLRQEENQYLSVPIDVAAGLPDDLLRLMGYARGAFALGYIDDLRDPIEALRPGTTTPGWWGSEAVDEGGPASDIEQARTQ